MLFFRPYPVTDVIVASTAPVVVPDVMEGTHDLLFTGTQETVLGGLIPFVFGDLWLWLIFLVFQRYDRHFNNERGLHVSHVFHCVAITRPCVPTAMLYSFKVVHCRCGYASFHIGFLGRSGCLGENANIRVSNNFINGSGNEVIRRYTNSNGALRLSTKRLIQLVFRAITRSRHL